MLMNGLFASDFVGSVCEFIFGVFAHAFWERMPVQCILGVFASASLGVFASAFWECLRVHVRSVCDCVQGVFASAFWECLRVHVRSVCECMFGVFASAL